MERIFKIVIAVLAVALVCFMSFKYPKIDRENNERKKLQKLEIEQKDIIRNIVFGKNEKMKAVRYICAAPEILGKDHVITDEFLVVILKRMAIDFKITKNDLSEYLKKNPLLVDLWLAKSAAPVADAYLPYFANYSFYYNDRDGYYYLKTPGTEQPIKSLIKYVLCAEYMVKICLLKDIDENMSSRASYLDSPFKRKKFYILFKKQGYDYIFANREIQEKLFGKIIE